MVDASCTPTACDSVPVAMGWCKDVEGNCFWECGNGSLQDMGRATTPFYWVGFTYLLGSEMGLDILTDYDTVHVMSGALIGLVASWCAAGLLLGDRLVLLGAGAGVPARGRCAGAGTVAAGPLP